jgi:hypothetical protein
VRWVMHARRLLGFTEIDDVLSRVETVEGSNMSAAVAKALDIREARRPPPWRRARGAPISFGGR